MALSLQARLLHQLASEHLSRVPDVETHLSAKPTHRWVAIERHDHQHWTADDPKDRFMWMKGTTKIKISKIRMKYLSTYEVQDPNLSVTLKFDLEPLREDARVAEIDYCPDLLVVLKAEVSNDSQVASTVPLNSLSNAATGAEDAANAALSPIPSNRAANGAVDASSTSTPTSLRPPLQPVNRQLGAVANESEDRLTPKDHGQTAKDYRSMSPYIPKGGDVSIENVTPQRTNPDMNSAHPSHSVDDARQALPPTFEPQIEVTQDAAPGTDFPSGRPRTDRPNHEAPSMLAPPSETLVASESQEYEPRTYDDVFLGDDGDEVEPSMRGGPLKQLAQETNPERLECGVKAGVDILSKLQVPLEQLKDHPDAHSWLQQIEQVREQAVKSRTVVGVVGNTGAGKSSVINAMLDEERLVPTNCMRACTAVVTELSYNESKSDNSKYRAEIEFIQAEDWRKELNILFDEVFDDNGNISKEVQNQDSQAGIAYAKIRAVYHKHTRDMLSKATVESLMRVKHVDKVLGMTRKINERAPDSFYRRLQHFVDSKEKGTEKLDKNGKKVTNVKREFEHWPLIKVVRIYTKADALSTGAVIVDLPGVHDSNAARAAVAEGYMKQCTGLWIVAPINRAVDDKAAKNLLGTTFKRQLKYDGTYSAVTFICSKTDDISRTEAADSLQLGEEMDEIEEKIADVSKRRRELSKQLSAAKGSRQDYADTIEEVEKQLEKWEELSDELEAGKTVYAPSLQFGKKRKRASSSPKANKRRRSVYVDSDSDDDDIQSVGEEDVEEETDAASGYPLTADQIEEKLGELKTLKKDARRERGTIDEQMRGLRKEIASIEEEECELDERQNELCIAGRNEYSRSAIRQDFAAGIRELDQENAEEEDPDNFNPEEDIRDYDEVANSLPVFCVSSRAYQKLSGRLQKDNDVAGFTTSEQTEVPQLQAHCKKLTEHGRKARCRRFLNSLSQLMNSLGLFASDDGTGAKLTVQQRDAEKVFLARKLKELEKTLRKCVNDTLDDVADNLAEQLFEKFPPAADTAVDAAIPTSSNWGAHKNDGGLYWATYKATVRRSGVFQGVSGFRDFNAALTEPLYKYLATNWEKTFQRRIPHILQSFSKAGTDMLKSFHKAVENRCREKGHAIARISVLSNQLTMYQAIFTDIAQTMTAQLNDSQRDINREFTPVIAAGMERAYILCTNESGTGSFKRMKSHMHDHVDASKALMFAAACEKVRKSLAEVCQDIRDKMLDKADSVFVNMQRDYLSIIGGVNVESISMPREERAVKNELDESISEADVMFQELLDCDPYHEKLVQEIAEEIVSEEDEGDEDEDDEDERDEEEGDDDEVSADEEKQEEEEY